jgi:hypothetical protein
VEKTLFGPQIDRGARAAAQAEASLAVERLLSDAARREVSRAY